MTAIDQNPDYSWLPRHQEHVVFTLAHVDGIIDRLSSVLFKFQERGPFDLVNGEDESQSFVAIARVQPLPSVVPRLFADAATQMRAAVEHALFAQVEFELGRSFDETDLNPRAVEMPATTTMDAFTKWLANGSRKRIGPMQEGEELVSRIRRLQPFWHVEPETHAMKLLSEHTNHAKHRAPATAVTRVGRVLDQLGSPNLELPQPTSTALPARVGDVVARATKGTIVPIAIYPDISVRRPHTGDWRVLAHELNNIFEWVRSEALPILITGTSTVDLLPAKIDVTTGYETVEDALRAGEQQSSFQRHSLHLQAISGREDLVGLIPSISTPLLPGVIQAWLDSLSDAEVVDAVLSIGVPARDSDQIAMLSALGDLVSRAAEFAVSAARKSGPPTSE